MPTKIKKLTGVHKSRINQNEPDVPLGAPACPDHLDECARKEWSSICESLQSMGLLSTVHRPSLEAYCVVYSRWQSAEAKVRKHGAIVISKDKKQPYQSPYLSVANRAMVEMRKWLVEFGLTPSSLTRVTMAGTVKDDLEKKFFGVVG